MSVIYKGKVINTELSKNSFGGTELMRARILRDVDPSLLEKVAIHFSRVDKIYDDVPNIYYAHDLPNDPCMKDFADPEYRKQFAKIIFVSDWQAQLSNLVLGIPYSEFEVIPNGIEPIDVDIENKFKNIETVRLVYHTTPHRGLQILVPVVEEISKIFPNVHLDVYSSFGIYGWEERDKQYEEVFERIKKHPNMTYHGWKTNDEIRESLKKAHIFAFPSIWPETSCLALIEALSAGCIVVHPNLAALPETSKGWTIQYQYNENLEPHANVFANVLLNAVEFVSKQNGSFTPFAQKDFIDNYYNWDKSLKYRWETLLKNVINK